MSASGVDTKDMDAKQPDNDSDTNFPKTGIMPKDETQALQFLSKYPNYDGRGVIVAILDTGVDPGAIGLQVTSDGKPKVVDIVDTTGSGDLDTSKVVEGKAENQYVSIEGVSGKKLKLSSDWKNPTGKWHVGAKAEFELYPKNLKNRIKKEASKKFLEAQSVREAALQRKILTLESKAPTGDKSAREALEDLKEQLNGLRTLISSYDYQGRVFDVVVFHDGERFQCVVDTKGDGDLTGKEPITDYRHAQQYDTIDDKDLVNYSVNIYDNGNLVSMVVCCGSHGTHVAGITAAYFPDNPSMNGVAPGAQIVSVQIGDSRLGSMETNTGMVRAISAILENKCDLVNMSYGEPTSTPNSGMFPELCAELVNHHKVIFVSSAGNAGPALSTVGAPGSTTQELIGIGAYVSPQMMESEYIMRGTSTVSEIQYTWSSRGPAANGHLGVCVTAPGGAIAPVPQWTLQKNTLMNGTSMASPNACGGIALVLSALKVEKINYTPHSIRRACENSARWIDGTEPFAQGYGLLQINDCVEYLRANAKAKDTDINYVVSVGSGAGWVACTKPACGVYLRDPREVSQARVASISIKPTFHRHYSAETKQSFEQKIVVKSTAFWVDAPKYMLLHQGGRGFSIEVDPSSLDSGVHYAEVQGHDSTDLGKGALFRVPVTAIVPEKPQDKEGFHYQFKNLAYKPGHIVRKFFAVPEGATFAHIQLKTSGNENAMRFMVAALWLSPQEGYRNHEINRFVAQHEGIPTHFNMEVRPNTSLELVVAQYWSSLGVCTADVSVSFYGLSLSPTQVFLNPGLDNPAPTRVDIECGAARYTVEPSASLTHSEAHYRPDSAKIMPLPDGYRDLLPDQRYTTQIVLTYTLNITTKTSKAKVKFPALNGMLYDSPYGSQLYMIFNENKQHIFTGDAWPDAVTLDKGKYTVRVHVRHFKLSFLESLKQMILVLETPLAKDITVGVYSSYTAAVRKKSKLSKSKLESKQRVCAYLLASGSMPSSVSPGNLLTGTLTLGKSKDGAEDKIKYKLLTVVPPKANAASAPSNSSSSNSNDAKGSSGSKDLSKASPGKAEESKDAKGDAKQTADEEKTKQEDDFNAEIEKAVRAAQIAFVGKLKGEKLRKALDSSVISDMNAKEDLAIAEKITLFSMQVKAYGSLKEYEKVVEAADRLIGCIDLTKVAAFFGVKRPANENKSIAKEMEKDKKTLLKAYVRKANAIMEILSLKENKSPEVAHKGGEASTGDNDSASGAAGGEGDGGTKDDNGITEEDKKRFENAFNEVMMWANEKKDKQMIAPLKWFLMLLNKEYGKALKFVLGGLKSNPRDKDCMQKRNKVLSLLGWKDWVSEQELLMRIQCPYSFRCF